MKIRNIFLILAQISLLLVSCKKEENTTNNENTTTETNPTYSYNKYTISNKLYPLIFNSNSYWIYQDNNSNFDTVSINSIEFYTENISPYGPGQGSPGSVDFYNFKYHSSKYGDHEEQMYVSFITLNKINGPNIYISTKNIGEENTGCKILDIIDTILINNNIFSDVVLVQDHFSITYSTNKIDTINLYYADSIGIIKKEIFQNDSIITTWNLIEYYVNVLDSTEREALKPTYK